jgi:hypothetical protein
MASQGYENDDNGENIMCFPRIESSTGAKYASTAPKEI